MSKGQIHSLSDTAWAPKKAKFVRNIITTGRNLLDRIPYKCLSEFVFCAIILTNMTAGKPQILPITKETLEKDAHDWLSIVKYHESGTVIQLQADCEYYIPPKISDVATLKRYLGPYYRKYLLAYIRLDEKNLFEELKRTLIELCTKRKLAARTLLEPLAATEIVELVERAGFDIGLFISHTTQLFRPDEYQKLFDLEHLLRTHRNLSVVVFSEVDITHPRYALLADKCSSLFTHVIKYPFYSLDDSEQFIRYNEVLWGVKVLPKLRDEIVSQCGGHLWLVRQAIRYFRDHPETTTDKIFNHDLMIKKLEVVWSKFTETERNLIRKVETRSIADIDKRTHEFDYLVKIRVIHEEKGEYRLSLPLLKQILEKEEKVNGLETRDGRIFVQNVNVSREFSPEETQLLIALLENKNHVISRDLVAEKIWGSKWHDRYSDWAIDRLMHRLRRKFILLGLDKTSLKAVKRKGLKFG